MKTRSMLVSLLAATVIATPLIAPTAVGAQEYRERAAHHRQNTANQWKDIAIGSGALGLLGLFTHNNTLGIAGVAGGLYSAYRYSQDQKSADRIARSRAEFYSRPYVYHNGHKYVRKTVWRNGQKYYQFVRG